MYYCGNSFSAKYLITNIAGFSVGDIVVVKTNRDGGRNVSCWLIVREIIPTTKGQGYLRVDHSSPPPGLVFMHVPHQPNDWIAEGDFIAKAPDFITVGNIVGPFIASTFNGIPISYYQPEDNFNPTRHQIFNYSLTNPNQIVSKNANVMSNTEWSNFNYSGICFYERVYDKPRGGWNSLGNRIATLLSRQHILICNHYPNSQRTFTVTDGSSFYTRQARQSGGYGSGDDFTIPPGSPGFSSIGSGYMLPALYPTWFALQNPGKDITDIYPDLPINEWEKFSDMSIIAFKTPVPENATMLFALNKNKYRNIPQFIGFTGVNTYTGPSPLVIQSSFHSVGIAKTGSTSSTYYGGSYSSGSSGIGIDSFAWNNKPATVNYTDFLGGPVLGDSGSIIMFKFIDPNNNTKFVFGGQGLSLGSTSGAEINSSGVYQSCHNVSGYPPCSINNLYNRSLFTTGFSVFDDITYKIIKIMLDDKSWQITQPNRIIANNPELNIVESDLIQTYPKVVEIDSLVDPNTYISQFQALSLASGVNYFGSQRVFKGVPTETIFRENGTDFYTIGNDTYPEYAEILDDWYTGGFTPLVDLPVFYKLSPTDKLITDTTVNPNQQKQIFKHGGDLTGRLSLEEINKAYNTSGMVVYKTKK